MKTKAKSPPVFDAARQAEAEKTSRLRALRLAKEADDKATAAREAAAKAEAPKRRRVRARPAPAPAL